jgi:ribosomal protein L11 methylase PrmA
MNEEVLGASFRDPSGFVFLRDGVVHRQVNRRWASHYDQLMSSGLYEELTGKGLLIPHQEVEGSRSGPGELYVTLRPEPVPFISYPYEWAFSQLKDAALTTLRIQETALGLDMTLKDASAYNIQFRGGRPVFIDTLSFERYEEGRPWVGYRQFCQHFLAPLALMVYRDVRLSQLLRVHIDGVPLDLARRLLPGRAWFNRHLLLHIRIQARYQRRYQARAHETARTRPVSRRGLSGLLAELRAAVKRLDWKPESSAWAEYYAGDSYTERSSLHKREVVAQYLERIGPRFVLDLGANTGLYSRIASDRGIPTVACDVEPACVELDYREARARRDENLLPLVLDLANPSPGLGWANRERSTLPERRRPGTLMALALIHHLAIANNVPLPNVAAYFASLSEHLIIEFVPKSDPKVQLLLATREDVFPDYTQEGFETAFADHWILDDTARIEDSERTLYRMHRRRP